MFCRRLRVVGEFEMKMICHEKCAIKCILAMNCIDKEQLLYLVFNWSRCTSTEMIDTLVSARQNALVSDSEVDEQGSLEDADVISVQDCVDQILNHRCSLYDCLPFEKRSYNATLHANFKKDYRCNQANTSDLFLFLSRFSFALILFEKVISLFILRHSFCPRQSTSLQ